jgi:osmoprotectant transport system substrate-binding protein
MRGGVKRVRAKGIAAKGIAAKGIAAKGMCALFALMLFAACSGGGSSDGGSIGGGEIELGGPQGTVRLTVGAKGFTEQEILGQITVQALEAAGAETIYRGGLGTEDARRALLSGEVDMYWEYTGTGWLIHLAEAESIPERMEQYEAISEADLEQNDIEWLEPAPANNSYAIAVREDAFEDVQTISDLEQVISEHPEDATICVGEEFSDRADGLPGLEQHYGFEFPDAGVSVLPDSTVYGAVENGERCAFGSVFETDGRIPALGLRLLEDDEGFFSAYNPSLNVSSETLDRYPELEELFAPISEELDTETLRELSGAVELEGGTPAGVAERWLRDNGSTG